MPEITLCHDLKGFVSGEKKINLFIQIMNCCLYISKKNIKRRGYILVY